MFVGASVVSTASESVAFQCFTWQRPSMNPHNAPLNRQDHLRKDAAALTTLWERSDARVIPICDGHCLIRFEADLPTMVSIDVSPDMRIEDSIFLGTSNDSPWFTLTLHESDPQLKTLPDDSEFLDLRRVGPQLTAEDSAFLIYAKGLNFWHQRTQYCELCASALTNTQGGHAKQCSNKDCAQLVFPRTDPAVIMLVTRIDATGTELCLLGRSPVWPPGMYSTLAGFVESGESLEDAVAREVFEESGVVVEDVEYIDSQPWPFPRSIMLGFRSTAITDTIKVDPNELEDAQWFSRDDLAKFGAWGDTNFEYQLPRTDSIAHKLITQWMAG